MLNIIETERLILRDYSLEKDLSPLHSLFTNEKAMTYYSSLKTIPETKEWIEWNIESYSENGYGLYALLLKADNTFIGQCGLILQKDVDGVEELEIGYALLPTFWGHGYATEAAIATKEYAFNNLNVSKVISLIDPLNRASINVALRNGMKFEKEIIRWNKTIHVYSTIREV